MRERRGLPYEIGRRAYRRLRRFFDSDCDVEIEPLQLGFAVCFRHDMDNFDASNFADFLAIEQEIAAPSTLFFMEEQFTTFGDQIRRLDPDRYECGLHSEAKPTPWCWSLPQVSRWLECSYAWGLRRQVRLYRRALGVPRGHSAHAVNNYLPFQGWINWNIIENASLRAGLDYISDWRLPARTAEGEEFQPPWPAYRRRRGAEQILVLPTSWDDKYFFYSYEDQRIRQLAPADQSYRSNCIEAAWNSFLRQAEHCRALQTPAIVNIHPWHAACNSQPIFYDFKQRVVEWCRREYIDIKRCCDYL